MATKKANELIRAEPAYQEAQDTEIINDELQRSGAEPLPQVDQSEIAETMHGAEALDVPVGDHDLEEYVGDQAYMMYKELLEIVRTADDEEDGASEPSTQAHSKFAPNMSEVQEEEPG